MTLYDHPDYLTMAQIVNGNDDLSEADSAAAITAYIAETIGVPIPELAAAAKVEATTVTQTASKNGIDVVARTAWAVGFFFGLRMSRGITTEMINAGDAYLDVDKESVSMMAYGRTRLMLAAPLYRADFRRTERPDSTPPAVSSGEGHIAEAAWLDGTMTGIHFDKARIEA